ncbi:MAG: hypothetical protein Q8P41_17865 [Pseudomonadota bacterium]|nr:hypothetical protein [Pseudomonadota bacterium]
MLRSHGPAPTDRTVTKSGRWTLDQDGRITLRFPDGTEQVVEVEVLEPERLVFKK